MEELFGEGEESDLIKDEEIEHESISVSPMNMEEDETPSVNVDVKKFQYETEETESPLLPIKSPSANVSDNINSFHELLGEDDAVESNSFDSEKQEVELPEKVKTIFTVLSNENTQRAFHQTKFLECSKALIAYEKENPDFDISIFYNVYFI